jgi:hypothetical protein
MKRIFFIAILLSATILYICCTSDNDCRENRYVVMTSNFYTLKNDTAKAVTMDSIWVKGVSNDSIIYKNTKSITSISLPLQKMKDTTRFVVRFNATYDTLTLIHTNVQSYLSLECGCLVTHVLDTSYITHHKAKSTKILHNNVSTKKIENVQIYF